MPRLLRKLGGAIRAEGKPHAAGDFRGTMLQHYGYGAGGGTRALRGWRPNSDVQERHQLLLLSLQEGLNYACHQLTLEVLNFINRYQLAIVPFSVFQKKIRQNLISFNFERRWELLITLSAL